MPIGTTKYYDMAGYDQLITIDKDYITYAKDFLEFLNQIINVVSVVQQNSDFFNVLLRP